eukprot:TRINITY_DN2563_c0_g1_i1.p1 TRINITY_DN2563_c0_g1~~TRINITY_DN2563_c0_g1_i1.p1  ORF type:complete len:400 (-),score=75.96 TRINITY_DN2563_c0_g1_i1:35-1234(-)
MSTPPRLCSGVKSFAQLLVLCCLASLSVQALTNAEIAMFKTSGSCLPSSMSTGYKSNLCASINITDDGSNLTISTNSIPDHDILKDYKYRDIYRGFCITISGQSFSMTVSKNPTKNANPTCVPSVAGIALNGVEIWNQYNPENLATSALTAYKSVLSGVPNGVDAGRGYMGEPMDVCGGHPGPMGTSYHYHKLPPQGRSWDAICFANITQGVPSGILGVAVDGFPIYGPFDENGTELTPADLDECNGRTYNGSYRYIMTRDFPYGPGCLWGNSAVSTASLCWKAADYQYYMNLTNNTLYSDCTKDPYSASNGTAGCMSFFSNPGLYVSKGKGSLSDFNTAYTTSCGSPDSKYENAVAGNTTTTTNSPTASPTKSSDASSPTVRLASVIFAIVIMAFYLS